MEESKTNSKVGRKYLPWTPKSISRTRMDIKSWNRALNMYWQADDPVNWPLQLIYNEVGLDATLTSQINNRKNQVFSADWVLKKENGDPDEEQTAVLKSHPIFRKLTDLALNSIYYGYELAELSLIPGKDGKPMLHAGSIPRYNVVPRTGRFYPDYGETSRYINYRDLPEFGTWILEFDSGDIGLMNKVVPHVLFKRFAQACWSELCEIFGIPPRVMKTNTQDATMLNRAEKMMRDMGSASWFIIDETEEFEFAKGVSTSGDVYKNLITLCRDEICMAITGAILGQDTENGSRSKDQVAMEVLWLLVQSDMAMLEEVWTNTILPALVKHGVIKGDLRFEFLPSEDTGQLWTFTEGLIGHYDIDPGWLKEKFGVEVTGAKQRNVPPPGEDQEDEQLGLRNDPRFFLNAPAQIGANCCGSHLTLSLPTGSPKSDPIIARVAAAKGQLVYDPETFRDTARTLIKAFNEGAGGNRITLNLDPVYGLDDPHLVAAFEMNLFRFSAGKTLAQVQALNQAFREAKSFDIFQMNARQIGDVFNTRWLTTEYDTAVLTAESTATYHSLIRDRETFPFWQYRTVGDGAVRAEHAELDGLILPVDDPLWDKIFPPNGWNCRCYIVAMTANEAATANVPAMRKRANEYFGTQDFDRAVKDGFGVNRATAGQVFTANQQYITGKNLTATNKLLNDLGPEAYQLGAPKLAGKTPSFEATLEQAVSNMEMIHSRPTLRDVKNRPLIFPETDGTTELIAALIDTLANPGELWMRIMKGDTYQLRYIRYYEEGPVLVTAALENKRLVIQSWKQLTEKQLQRYRKGLLIQG